MDGFLQDVRKELEMTGRLDSKTILVGSDGVWRVKPEAAPTARKSASKVEDEKEVGLKRGFNKESERAAGKGKLPVEIIELDDD